MYIENVYTITKYSSYTKRANDCNILDNLSPTVRKILIERYNNHKERLQ